MIITPMTKLDSINEILSAVGEVPVDTLEDAFNVDIKNAERLLNNITREVLSQGWTFNIESTRLTEDNFTHQIEWSPTFLVLKSPDGRILRRRSNFIYDVTNSTDKFKGGLDVEIIRDIPFEDIPSVFRRYITARTACMFAKRYMGDEGLSQHLSVEEQQAYMHIMEYEMDLEQNTFATNPDIINLTGGE